MKNEGMTDCFWSFCFLFFPFVGRVSGGVCFPFLYFLLRLEMSFGYTSSFLLFVFDIVLFDDDAMSNDDGTDGITRALRMMMNIN